MSRMAHHCVLPCRQHARHAGPQRPRILEISVPWGALNLGARYHGKSQRHAALGPIRRWPWGLSRYWASSCGKHRSGALVRMTLNTKQVGHRCNALMTPVLLESYENVGSFLWLMRY